MSHPGRSCAQRRMLLTAVLCTWVASHASATTHHQHHRPEHYLKQVGHQHALADDFIPSASARPPKTTKKAARDLPGRYGHAAVAVGSKEDEAVLFIGGQITGSDTYITNDVLSFSPGAAYAGPSDERPNPRSEPRLSAGLPPRAWGSSAVDAEGRVWLVGGLVENCTSDAGAYIRSVAGSTTSGWKAWTGVNGTASPARRRQAAAVTVARTSSVNGSDYPTLSAVGHQAAGALDFLVLGGIADQYTCGDGVEAYLGVDRWIPSASQRDLSDITVSTHRIPDPLAAPEWSITVAKDGAQSLTTGFTASKAAGPHPAITDYAATSLAGRWVIVTGGQLTNGTLATMDHLSVLDSKSGDWMVLPVAGTAPAPRMGHSLTELTSGIFFLHGGLSAKMDPLSTSYLLNCTSAPWQWVTMDLSAESKRSLRTAPPRGYHSAVALKDGRVLVAFGMGSGGQLVSGADAFWFATVDGASVSWEAAVPSSVIPASHASSSSSRSSTLSAAPERVPAYSTARVEKTWSPLSTTPATTVQYTPSVPVAAFSTPSSADTIPVASSSQSQSPPTESSSSENDFPTASKVAAGVVTACVASAAIAGGLILIGKRRALSLLEQSDRAHSEDTVPPMPPVTTLYTRPTPMHPASLRRTSRGSARASGRQSIDENPQPPYPPRGPVASVGDETIKRHASLYRQLRLPSMQLPPPTPATVLQPRQTSFTGDGILPSLLYTSPTPTRRPTGPRAPPLRRASRSHDSTGSSGASVESYPYLMSIKPDRLDSSPSSQTSSPLSRTDSTKTLNARQMNEIGLGRPPIGTSGQSLPLPRRSWSGRLKSTLESFRWQGSPDHVPPPPVIVEVEQPPAAALQKRRGTALRITNIGSPALSSATT